MEFLLSDFFSDIGVVSATFTLSDQRRMGRDRGGVLSPTGYGARWWGGTVDVRPHYHDRMEDIEARMTALTAPGGTFRICPPSRVKQTGTSSAIASILEVDRRQAEFDDNGNIAIGDYFGVLYDGGRRGLHQITAVYQTLRQFEPPLPLSVQVGDAVTFGRPNIRAIVMPGSYNAPAYSPVISDGLSFEWQQTLAQPA